MRADSKCRPSASRALSVVIAGLVALGVTAAASAGPPTLVGGEDDHYRPPLDLLDELAPWVPNGIEPEYPLAEAFVPADPSNYVVGGISSYDYIVVHTQQGYYNGTISWFQNPSSNVSAHYVLRSNDGAITQMVSDWDRAWHVGSSNPYAIGLEHEGFIEAPDKWYTWPTYRESSMLARWLADTHAIPVDRDHVLGHVELPNQSHTDPGDGWDWDLYMGLIDDVVGEGRIRAVVVDRDKACTLTAGVDTWITRAPWADDALGPADKCLVPAGAQVHYFWASGDVAGYRRLVMTGGEGPCAGYEGLDEAGYVVAGHFTPLCAPGSMTAPAAGVRVDGGALQPVAADGSVILPSLSPGSYTIDAEAPAYEPAAEVVDLEVFPGGEVVLALDVQMAQGTGGDDGGTTGGDGGSTGGGSTSGGSTSGGSTSGGSASGGSTSGGSASGSASGGSGGSGGGSGASGGPGASGGSGDDASGGSALPPGYGLGGQDGDYGCACRSGGAGGSSGGFLVALALACARRRRRV